MFCRKLWWTAYGPTRSPRLSPECRLFEFAMFCRKLWWTAYGPTKRLAIEDRIAASSLKLNVHFAKRTGLESYVSQFQMQVKIAEAKYYEGSSFEASTVNAARCSLRILENCSRLLSKSKEVSKRIRNEAELRYVVGNPIMEFICTEGTAKVKLEESVEHSSSEQVAAQVPSTSTQDATLSTPRSKNPRSSQSPISASVSGRSFYAIYTIRSETNELLAVVVETKMEIRSTDVRAQVMGYVSAFAAKDIGCPPMALVITELQIHICLFPFVTEDEEQGGSHLHIGCWYNCDIWMGNEIDKNVLSLVGFLCLHDNRANIKVRIPKNETKPYEEMRQFSDKIETQSQALMKGLKKEYEDLIAAKDEEYEDSLAAKDEEIKNLRAELKQTNQNQP